MERSNIGALKEFKYIEIRDRMTFIPALAFKLSGSDSWLAWRAGFDVSQEYVVLFDLNRLRACFNPVTWMDRTMKTVHEELVKNWRDYEDGALLDVEFLLGEEGAPKISESFNERMRTVYGDNYGSRPGEGGEADYIPGKEVQRGEE